MNPKLLPEHMKKLIPAEERKKLGVHTAEELSEKIEAKLERDLHEQIMQELNRRGIVYDHDRMDRKRTGTPGWPDFTFSITITRPSKSDPTGHLEFAVPNAWECKIGNARLDSDQEHVRKMMATPPNGWRYVIIRSLKEACDELISLGI